MRALAESVLDGADIDDPGQTYFATYALYQMGGRSWQVWSERVAGLVAAVADDGRDGSGAPLLAGDGDRWPSRVADSALRALTLEAYYRYTRLVR